VSPLIPAAPAAPPKVPPLALIVLDATKTKSERHDFLTRPELSFLFEGTFSGVGLDIGDFIALPSQQELLEGVRDRAGLTWEQVSRLLGVSRRSVHKWLRGEKMASSNEERLHQLNELVAMADAGNGFSTRSRLLDSTNGLSAFDLFRSGRTAEAIDVAAGVLTIADPFASLRVPPREISPTARAARRGPKLGEILNVDPSQEGVPSPSLSDDDAVIRANSDGD
jgi:transcriptional regulator with XRE-family HTH domain